MQPLHLLQPNKITKDKRRESEDVSLDLRLFFFDGIEKFDKEDCK